MPVHVATYLGAVVFFFAMSKAVNLYSIVRKVLKDNAVLLQVRAYALCDMRRAVLYMFFTLDVLAFVLFAIEATSIKGEPKAPLLPRIHRRRFIYFLLVEGETRGEVDLSEINLLSGVTQAGYAPIFWIPFILNETVTFALVVHKARKSGRFPGVGRAASTILFDTLIQHSIFYYLTYVIFAALVQWNMETHLCY